MENVKEVKSQKKAKVKTQKNVKEQPKNGLKDVREVDSLKGIEMNTVYQTKNYDMLKETEGNRSGISERRVRKFEKLIKEGKFINDVSITLVNKNGYIIDAHHRTAALKNVGKPINFLVTDSPAFNGKDQNKILNNIATINSSINPSWTKDDHFSSALNSDIPVAKRLKEVRDELVDKFSLDTKKISKNNISISDIYGILKRDIKVYGSKISRNQLEKENDELMKEIDTQRFQEDVLFYAKLVSYFKNSAYRSYKIVKEVFALMWKKDSNFSKDRFYDNLVKDGYSVHSDKVDEHRTEIERLNNKTRRGRRKSVYEDMPVKELESIETPA